MKVKIIVSICIEKLLLLSRSIYSRNEWINGWFSCYDITNPLCLRIWIYFQQLEASDRATLSHWKHQNIAVVKMISYKFISRYQVRGALRVLILHWEAHSSQLKSRWLLSEPQACHKIPWSVWIKIETVTW